MSNFGVSTGENQWVALTLAESRVGQIFPFQVLQSFGYAESNGNLPLFPYVYTEWVQALNLTGTADSKKLYATPALEGLSDVTKMNLMDVLVEKISDGKKYHSSSYTDPWLDL